MIISIGNFIGNSQQGEEAATVPSPLIANSVDNTNIQVSWQNVGADSYVGDIADDSGFTTGVQSIADAGYVSGTSFTISGLPAGTRKYVRVKAVKAGMSDSAYVTDSAATISFVPDVWYEMTGLERDVDNAYGTFNEPTQGSLVDTLKSVVNTGGPTATWGLLRAQWKGADPEFAYPVITANNGYFDLDSDISLTGDFTVMFTVKIIATPVNNVIFCDRNATDKLFRITNLTSFQFNIGNGVLGSTFNSAMVVGGTYDMVVQRSGTNIKVSNDGGATFKTVAGGTVKTFALNRLFANNTGGNVATFYYKRFVVKASVLTTSQITEAVDYLKRPAYTPANIDANPDIKGVTWSDLTDSNYYINNTMSSAATAASNRDRVINRGNKTFILLHKIADTTYYLEDFVVVYDHSTGKLSSPISFGIPVDNTDVHNNGSIFLYDNRLYHAEYDQHYDNSPKTKLIVKRSAIGFDLGHITTSIHAKGVPAAYVIHGQYNNGYNILSDNKLYFVAQLPDTSTDTVLYISEDNLNFCRKLRVIKSDSTAEFTYPNLIAKGPDDVLRLFIGNPNTALSSRYLYSYYIESHDKGNTWQNIEGTFTKDVRNDNGITLAELRANCVLVDASTLAGQAKVTHCFVDNGGEVYGVIGNGEDTGFKMFYGTSGGSFTFKDVGVDGKTVPYTLTGSDGDNLPFLIKRGDQVYDFYCHETNGGNWRIIRIRTTDKGDTWTYQETLTNDDMKKHQRMMPTKNAMSADYITLAAMRNQTTYGDLFIADITQP